MRTTFDIPLPILAEAQKVIGVKTKTQAIILALQEAISRRKSRKLLALKGSMKNAYDYKESRRKR